MFGIGLIESSRLTRVFTVTKQTLDDSRTLVVCSVPLNVGLYSFKDGLMSLNTGPDVNLSTRRE